MPDDPKDRNGPTPEETATDGNSAVAASRRKRRVVALALAAVVVVGGGIAAFVLLGGGDEPGVVTLEIGGETVYHEFPEILTHLSGGETSSNHAKLEIVIQIPESHADVLQEKEPVIFDAIQSYLRGKTRAELAGEAGAEQLRGELLVIINQRIAPAEATDILFKTFLID